MVVEDVFFRMLICLIFCGFRKLMLLMGILFIMKSGLELLFRELLLWIVILNLLFRWFVEEEICMLVILFCMVFSGLFRFWVLSVLLLRFVIVLVRFDFLMVLYFIIIILLSVLLFKLSFMLIILWLVIVIFWGLKLV